MIDGQPYCTPKVHWRDGTTLFWHGSSVNRLLKANGGSAPVCLTVSLLDGLVVTRSAYHHTANYRCAMCFGTARLIEDDDEKAAALDAMVERLYPGRLAGLRPNTAQEMKATSVVRMEIEDASAKVRTGGGSNAPDELDYPAWSGIIPVKTVIGHAVPDESNIAEPAMQGIDQFTVGRSLDDVLAGNAG
ncbi:pyridoxamine 5'-phosphate oxidase family protein [Rhizobium sp. L1K21]|nr:pyridoxamine 5'-phosphate oxidase family protein [Rhizobium sp. L1K21]